MGLVSELIFLGSGSSGGTPTISHLVVSDSELLSLELDKDNSRSIAIAHSIRTSRKAAIGDPRNNKNYRCNPSICLQYRNLDETNQVIQKNIIIDVGKTFRESAIRWFPYHQINTIDAVILTHGHADAIFGLDDLRSTRLSNSYPIEVYQSEECQKTTQRIFDYLYPKVDKDQSVQRFVSNIDWKNFYSYQSFRVCNLDIFPIPVKHGEDLDCMGFLFGKNQKVCYLSDISRMIPKTMDFIKDYGDIDLLIIDALNFDIANSCHFSLMEAIDVAKQIRPKKVYTVGMSSSIDYDDLKINQKLKELLDEGIDLSLAYDGLKLSFEL